MKLFDPKLTGSIEIQSEVSGSLIPTTTEVFDLGSPTARWRDIYLSGSTIDLGGTKITTDASGDISIQDGLGNAKKIKVEEILVGSGNNQKRIKIDNGKLSMVDKDGNPDTQMVGHMMPHGNNQYDLGSPTAQWRDLYLSSASLYIDGTQVLSSDSNVLTITTDAGQSLKLLETGADDITLQTDTGNIELKGTVEILSGKKIIDSAGSIIQFGDNIGITGSIEVSGTVDGIDLQAMSSSLASRISSLDNEYATDAQLNAVSASVKSFATSADTTLSASLASAIASNTTAISNLDSTYATDTQLNTVSASVKSFATSADTTLSSSLAIDIKANDSRLDTLETKNLISQSAQIATDISGSTTALSASIATRFEGLTTDYTELDNIPANIVSGSIQIRDFGAVMDNEVADLSLVKGLTATKISGSFTAASASLASNIANNSSNISSLNASTSSYLLNTTDTLTGNLTVTGTLTAQQFNTEFVSASILFDSGSTKFGDSSDDKHDFTGSVGIDGDVRLKNSGKIYLWKDNSSNYLLYNHWLASTGASQTIQNTGVGGITFKTLTSARMFISASGDIGIGTTTPAYLLDVAGTQRVSGELRIGANINAYQGDASIWVPNVGQALTVKQNTGNVGIGTDTPAQKLDVAGTLHATTFYVDEYIYHNADTDTALRFTDDSVQLNAGGVAMLKLTEGSADVVTINPDSNDVDFQVNGNTDPNVLFVNGGTNRVGIGTPAPSARLHITGSGEIIRLQGDTGQSYMTFFQGTGGRVGYIGTSGTGMILESADYLRLYTSGSDAVHITGDNKVGIGVTPSYALHVKGTTNGSHRLFVENGAAGQSSLDLKQTSNHIRLITDASYPFRMYDQNNGAERFTLTAAGNIGIGTTTANEKLSVLGAISGSTYYGDASNLTGRIGLATSASHAEYADNATSANSATSATSASHAEYADNSNLLDNLNSSQFLRSDTGDTMTGLLTFRGTTAANNSLIRLGAGGASSSYTTVDIVKTADTSGDMVFMAYHAGEAYSTSSPKIIFGHYDGTPVNGHVLTVDTNAKNVGIGTTSPSFKLDVNAGGSQGAVNSRLTQNFGRARFHGVDILGYDDEVMWIIGNNSSTNTELVLGNAWDWDQSVSFKYTPNTTGNAAGGLQIGQLSKNNANWTHGHTAFHTNGSERMRINHLGNVGIGTITPDSKLHLQSASATGAIINLETTHTGGIPIFNLKGAHSAQVRYQDENGNNQSRIDFTDSGSFNFIDATDGSSHMYIKSDGNVGIKGITNPTRALHVNGEIEGTIFRDGSYYLDPSSNSVLAGNLTVGTNLTVYGDTTLGNSQDDNTLVYGNLSGVLDNSGEGLSKIEGFIAEIGAENGENQFILPGSTQNELAGATERFTVAATLNGNATSLASAVFKSTHHYQNISVSTNDTVVITITNASFNHSSGVGIVFSSRAWRARNITIETTTDGTNWTSRGSVTNYAYSSYYVTFNTGGTATTGIRYTLTNFNTTSTRIAHLFANNYAGGEAYHVDKWYADTKYNQLSIDSSGETDNYYLRFQEGGSDRFTIYENGNNVYFNGTAGHTIFRPQISGGGSFAVYGGNTQFDTSGNGTLAGNLTVAGTITAQQFHTEYVSSSILHESGSTSFGNSSDDVHNFTGSVNVQGNVSHEGLTMTDGTDIDQIKTFQKSLTITTSWMDTGIKATDLATGTYIIQLHTNNHGVGGGHYDERYSGIMSWYAGNPNSSDSDEIVLHKAGHAPNNNHIYLRTLRTSSADTDDLKLQIASTATTTGNSTYTFKFRRMI